MTIAPEGKPGGGLPKLQAFLLGLALIFAAGVLLWLDLQATETDNRAGMHIAGELLWMSAGAVLIICAVCAAFHRKRA